MTITLESTSDTYDCETCGTSWADGFKIFFDGKLAIELKPVAHCCGGDSFTPEDALVEIIKHLGHDIIL
jgi:hypothetical protein